ncbi:hypothetical protein PIROE2DRAFT_63626 [Piromyces sp. E2]|nr:hypothetical protein PIROE2DRAFT_63626 [Piromyces sp. E2]|eukprot:OUM59663.1 hypothetical protein PIROE2DRAFT_63626 [Piromyces sp. E2]
MDGLIRNMNKDNEGNKYEEVDDNNKTFLQAKTKSNVINIKIQLFYKGDLFKESLFYSSSIIKHSLHVETGYSGIPDVVIINLLNYDMFDKNNPKFHWTYGLIERQLKKEDKFCKPLNFHFIELKKFMKQINKNNNEANKNELIQGNPWLYFKNNPNDKFFRNNKTSHLFKKAREKLLSLQKDPEFYFKYVLREMELIDTISGYKQVEEIYLKRGRKEGTEINELKEYKWVSDNELVILNSFLMDPNTDHDIGRLANNLDFEENILEEILNSLKIPYINSQRKKRKIDKEEKGQNDALKAFLSNRKVKKDKVENSNVFRSKDRIAYAKKLADDFKLPKQLIFLPEVKGDRLLITKLQQTPFELVGKGVQAPLIYKRRMGERILESLGSDASLLDMGVVCYFAEDLFDIGKKSLFSKYVIPKLNRGRYKTAEDYWVDLYRHLIENNSYEEMQRDMVVELKKRGIRIGKDQ